MSRTAAAEAAGEADDPSAVADAYYDEATNLTLFKEDEVGGGYQCFENGSILVPLNEGGNQTVHSPEDVNEKFHKINPLGLCWYRGECYMFDMSTYSGPQSLTVPIYGYIMPILLAVTFLSNILIIIVLSKKHMRSPTNLVLMSMAISDLLTVVFPAPWYFYVFTLGNDGPIANKETGYSYDAMVENMPQIFHTASIWLTLLLALQRYIYVCHASMARTWCTISRTKKAVACTILFAFLHQTTRFCDKRFEDVTIEDPICSGNYIEICRVSFADWVVHGVTMNGYFITFFWFRVLFVHLIPCTMLVVLNILLFRTMKEAERKRERLLNCRQKKTAAGESKESKKLRDSNCTTLMLIVVITVFLAVELPMGIIVILHNVSSSVYEFLDYKLVHTTTLIINLLICLSYPLNFGIYCGMSRAFRETFKELFMKRVPSPGTTVTAAAATTNAPAATTATTAGNGNGNGQRSTVLKISPNKTANGNTIVSPGAVHQIESGTTTPLLNGNKSGDQSAGVGDTAI